MKKFLFIALAMLVVLIVLSVVGLQVFLMRGLTPLLNTKIFPAVKDTYGLEASISGAAVNLFRGTVTLENFELRNLDGYTEPHLLTFDRCHAAIDLFSLLRRDPVVIKKIEALGAVLTVEKNAGGTINVEQLIAVFQPEETPVLEPAAIAPVVERPAPVAPAEVSIVEEPLPVTIPLHIQNIIAEIQIRAVNFVEEEISLNTRFTAGNIFTVPAEDQPDTLIVLRGALTKNKQAYVTDLNAFVQPLTDPEKPSFNAAGSVIDIDAEWLDSLLKKNRAECSSFSIKPSITCRAGVLDGSRIEFSMNDLNVQGAEIGALTLNVPLSGTVQNPVFEFGGALRSVFSEQSLSIGKTLLKSSLTNNVKELSDAPETQKLIEQILPGQTGNAATNRGEVIGGAIAEQLEKNVKELQGNEEVKDAIKKLGTSIFGK
ncbi:MAG: hypothetical protein WC959_10470 [Kiritimatiellales bacterium]